MGNDRTHSKTHPGVSASATGPGRWRIRWREMEPDGRRVSRTWRLQGTALEAEEAAIQVYRSVRATGTFPIPEIGPKQPTRPQVADLRDLFASWAEWRVTHHNTRVSTMKIIKGALQRFEAEVRMIEGLPADGPVPVAALTSANCATVVAAIQTPRTTKTGKVVQPGKHRTSQIMRYVYAAWAWAGDEPERWPGLAPAPRTKGRVVPAVPPPKRPAPAPAVEAMNAIVWIARNETRSADVWQILAIMRLTGLRQKQVRLLRVRDLQLDSPTPSLTLRSELGKSKHEAQGRIVPISPYAAALLRTLCDGRPADGEIFGRKSPISSHTLRKILFRAEEIGGLDARCWRGEERGNQRSSHLMRAGFLAALADAGVPQPVRGALVGHKPTSVEGLHYVPPTWEAMVEAVRTVPGLDWEPQVEDSNVVKLRRS